MNASLLTVTDVDGREATLGSAPAAGSAGRVTLRLDSGERMEIDPSLLERHDDGTYYFPVAFSSLTVTGETVRIPILEERLNVSKRVRETGRVRIKKLVETHEEMVDEPLLREDVEIQRVPVGRYVDEPLGVRREGDTTIIPVLEEVLVVEKRLLLKEELHVTKRRTEVREPQRIALRKEHVEVERLAPTDDTPESRIEP